MSAVWSLQQMSFSYAGATRTTLSDIDLELQSAQLTALVGPNGAGKSTLLQLLLGLIKPTSGSATFRERSLSEWTRKELALAIGVVPQGEVEPIFTVREIVAMGRYPHLGPWQREGDSDVRAIYRAMARCDVTEFADRWVSTLSGGERQRVRVARALAQETGVLVLDEPTTFLDIRHEMTVFELMRSLRNDGVTIVVATHNLNLAARYADDVVLLNNGHIVASGSPASVLTSERVGNVYEWPVAIAADENGAPQITPRSVALT